MTEEQIEKGGANAPKKRFKAGSCEATIWEQEGKEYDGRKSTYFTVSTQRSYKDKEDEWKTTSTYRVQDIADAILVLQESLRYMRLKASE